MNAIQVIRRLLGSLIPLLPVVFVFFAPRLLADSDNGGQIEASSDRRQSGVIEEVIVTAQRREQSIHDVSISISAFTGNQLKDLGITDTRDLGKLPGFSYADSGFTVPVFTIRGVGFNGQDPAASSSVGVYIDQANIPFPVMTKGVNLDLKRVEILKGPQGTLYGRNTTAGLVNYISAKPTQELSYGFEGGYGRFDRTDLEAYVSGPIIEDGLLGRIAYRQVRASEGWQKSLTRPDDQLGEVDRQSGRIIVEWTLAESFFLTISGNWWQDKSDSQAPQAFDLLAAAQDRQDTLGEFVFHESVRNHPLVHRDSKDMRLADWPPTPEEELSIRNWEVDENFLMGALEFQWDITNQLTLYYLGAYQDFDSDESRVPADGLSVHNVDFETTIDIKAYTHEVRFSGDTFNNTFDWTVGLFFGRDEIDASQIIFVKTATPGVPPPFTDQGNAVADVSGSKGNQRARTKAVFGHVEWQALLPVKVALGGRYNQEQRYFSGCLKDAGGRSNAEDDPTILGNAAFFNALSISQGGTGGAGPGDCVTLNENNNPGLIVRDAKEDSLSGRVALEWTPTDETLFYTSYTRGFKSGGYPILFGGATEKQYQRVEKEKLDAWEIGGKVSFFNRKMQLNVAGFSYGYEDKQLRSFIVDPVFGTLDSVANIPKSEVKGAELEIQTTPLPGLKVSAAVSYLQTEIKEFTGINARGEERNLAGNEFNFTPAWSYTIMLNYVRPVTRQLSVLFGADISFTGERNATLNEDPLFFMDDYTLVNYRLGLKTSDEGWSAIFWGRNVTNEFYVNNVFTGGSDTVARFTGPPQTYGITVTYHNR